MNTLKYVRPGNNFELNPAITVFQKGDVNGANQQPLFKWMKGEIMIPTGGDDDSCLVDTNDNGCGDADALVLPRGGFGGTTLTLWSPVARSDIAWNLEKFLLDTEMLQMMAETLAPLELSEAAMGFDAVKEVGPGGHFSTVCGQHQCGLVPFVHALEQFHYRRLRLGIQVSGGFIRQH